MSYNIYTTRGLVLSLRPLKEADRVYSILTRDLGLIYARALGVRKEASKLRGSLEPFSLSYISLVKGQAHWRVTSASLITLAKSFDKKKRVLTSLAKALSLLERLVQGEEKHPELFDAIEELFLFAQNNEVVGNEEAFELILVARALFHLGYLSENDVMEGAIKGSLNTDLLNGVAKNKKMIIKVINQGLKNTQLT